MLEHVAALARAAAGGDSNNYQQLLASLGSGLQQPPQTGGASSGSGSFWEKDFKLFADSMTTVSTDLTPTSITESNSNPLGALPPGTLTPSPSLHTPSPGLGQPHTPSPSLQAATPPPAAQSGSEIEKLEAARSLWARYLESSSQQ